MQQKILFILLIVCAETFAQTNIYHPLPDSNVIWREHTGGWDGLCAFDNNYQLFISGDTVIGSNSYKKIYMTGFMYYWTTCSSTGGLYQNIFIAGIRQDTAQRKVFIVPWGDTQEQLLYNFNLTLGDTLPPAYNNNAGNRVVAIDSMLIGLSYNKRFWLRPLFPPDTSLSGYIALIEGIGSTNGLMNPMEVPFEIHWDLYCVIENNQTVYPDTSSFCGLVGINEVENNNAHQNIFPNPSDGVFSVALNQKLYPSPFDIFIYDIFGRVTYQNKIQNSYVIDMSNHSSGVYIVKIISGKNIFADKVIVR